MQIIADTLKHRDYTKKLVSADSFSIESTNNYNSSSYLFAVNLFDFNQSYRFEISAKGELNNLYLYYDKSLDVLLLDFNYSGYDEKIKFDDIWVFCHIGTYDLAKKPDTKFVVSILGAPNVSFTGFLPNINLSTNANYLYMGERFIQENILIHAPNLIGLEIDVNAVNTLKLTKETNPIDLKTDGEKSVFSDPYNYDD